MASGSQHHQRGEYPPARLRLCLWIDRTTRTHVSPSSSDGPLRMRSFSTPAVDTFTEDTGFLGSRLPLPCRCHRVTHLPDHLRHDRGRRHVVDMEEKYKGHHGRSGTELVVHPHVQRYVLRVQPVLTTYVPVLSLNVFR